MASIQLLVLEYPIAVRLFKVQLESLIGAGASCCSRKSLLIAVLKLEIRQCFSNTADRGSLSFEFS